MGRRFGRSIDGHSPVRFSTGIQREPSDLPIPPRRGAGVNHRGERPVTPAAEERFGGLDSDATLGAGWVKTLASGSNTHYASRRVARPILPRVRTRCRGCQPPASHPCRGLRGGTVEPLFRNVISPVTRKTTKQVRPAPKRTADSHHSGVCHETSSLARGVKV
jgi:hypothetical protein